MATGDSDDIVRRLKGVIPFYWFAYVAPIRDAILGGLADSAAWCYSFIAYTRVQTRFKTMQGPWLDIASFDFLGDALPRRAGELDPDYSARVTKEILRPRNTRAAITLALTDLTGQTPQLMEMWNPGDCGAYDVPTSGYDVAGAYGDLALHNQIFVTAYRPSGQGIAFVPGYDNPQWGYDAASGEYTDQSMVAAPVSDADIYARVASVMAAGFTAWVAILTPNGGETSSPSLDFSQPDNSQYLPLL